MERLRYVARVEGADPGLVAREAADALAEVAIGEVAGLVPACRRLVDRHPTNGPLWWLSARVLASPDPFHEAREAGAALGTDRTARALADALPEPSDDTATTVLVIGWPDVAADALHRRGDLECLVVDGGGDGAALARHLETADGDAVWVPDAGVAAAASVCSIVLVEALAAGPGGMLAAPGSFAAAAVAARAGIPVWGVAGVGRTLPGPLWDALLARLDGAGREPWDRGVDVVPVDLLDAVVTAEGMQPAAEALATAGCPVAPELLRPSA